MPPAPPPAPASPPRLWEAEHPGKRAVERFWLAYTLVWGSIVAVVMLGRHAERWGDVGLGLLGASLGVGAVLGPFLFRAPEERGVSVHRTAAGKMAFAVVAFAFGMNLSLTPFFFDVLHMRYGFRASIAIEGNPVFLYLLTIAYFATYCALLAGAFRASQRLLAARGRAARWAAGGVAVFAVAGLETALNANPWTQSLFCYDDAFLALTFGTLCYGSTFLFALPVWMGIDERQGERVPLARVAIWSGAALYGMVLTFALYRHALAPLVTTVVEGARFLPDAATGGCLVPRP